MKSISAVIVTLNEEDRLEECLESVSFCDEIVVVDSGSDDRTVELARNYTDKTFHREWGGFRSQREYAIERAAMPWILIIDADERLSGDLAAEIRDLPDDPPESGFFIRRDFYFMGRLLKHGGAWPDWNIRLFRADKFAHSGSETHDFIKVDGETAKLRAPMTHFSYRNLTDYFDRFNRYTSSGAMERYRRGVKPGFLQNFRVLYEFIVRYVLRGGFLDGYPGFVYALISSFYAWTKYAKLRELTDNPPEEAP